MIDWDTQWFDASADVATTTAEDAASDEPTLAAVSEAELRRIMQALAAQTETDLVLEDDQAPPATLAAEPVSDELSEAFREDASRCLSEIEDALLAMEAEPANRQPLRQVCRELHTLKGASASIGMAALAAVIHELEERIRVEPRIAVAELLGALDQIRTLVELDDQATPSAELREAPAASPAEPPTCRASEDQPQVFEKTPIPAAPEVGAAEDLVRVKASQLNRMMDMLAELVMLRNRRSCELEHLRSVHDEILRGAGAVRVLSDECGAVSHAAAADSVTADRLATIAADLAETARRLRGGYQGVVETTESISGFIRQFRQELVDLRRLPIGGLFRRLRRAVSDAARAEGKRVELELQGEGTGIERTLQDRLFDPLLHIVRNAVSHGIETPERRGDHGKPASGRIVLQATAGPDVVTITIRDDGRGLDYDALRRRGIQSGLLDPHAAASEHELAQLIFHPGFSTRSEATEVSGRGVGMDVVASAIQRMRGWIQIESEAGRGTTIRLNIPLPSVIQHVMVFRAGGQLYALPMQMVERAGDVLQGEGSASVSLGRLLDFAHGPSPSIGSASRGEPMPHDDAPSVSKAIVLHAEMRGRGDERANDASLVLGVDEILGPDEVVVRPLPHLLRHHPLCGGATLAGSGEVVLVLDCHRVAELAQSTRE